MNRLPANALHSSHAAEPTTASSWWYEGATAMNSEFQAVRENLFPASHASIEDWGHSPGIVTKPTEFRPHKAHSSQAIAIDVFGTIKIIKDRDRIFDAIAARAGVAPGGPWAIKLEWTDTERLLGEPRSTQVDALAVGSMAALVIECKFTEPGGQCSQTASLRSGERQCNGSYVEKINPGNGLRARCALTGNGIRYWKYIPEVFALDAAADIRPAHLRLMPISGCAMPCWRQRLASTAICKRPPSQPSPIIPVSRRRGR
ncbi:hypothetical protein GA0061105_12024 [Rhizobium aethiopicum]|uniref:Uncharacterized protein n=1 Tax=Rhizobium aethiopicum TaxID=1138170 RepID=A0A1C3YAT7_9HYPH|nr:hypothetical protein GA0061105_12024 [Rhizobium aethiopicum]